MSSEPGRQVAEWRIRPYSGSVADAEGILAVERATFCECPYTAEVLQTRLQRPEQRAWIAEAGGQVIGFLSGICTPRVTGPTLEADLLAVHPAWQRQGIATALLVALRRDAAQGHAVVLRSVVRPENAASERAFARAGFVPSAGIYDLLIYRILGTAPRPLPAWGGEIGPLAGPDEAAQLAQWIPPGVPVQAVDSPMGSPAERLWAACRQGASGCMRGDGVPALTVLAARHDSAVVAAAEFVEVHTLLYAGLWLESLLLGPQGRPARKALIAAAVEWAKSRDLDEVGCLVPERDHPLRAALREEGFVPLDHYRTWSAAPLADGGRP